MIRRTSLKLPVVSFLIVLLTSAIALAQSPEEPRGRRITPITSAAAQTQAINEAKNDTARINAARRARSTHYHDDRGRVVWVDTITGEEWIDSLAMTRGIPRMKQPLFYAAAIGVDIWDPVMRVFGQKYGLVGFSAELNMHNRYIALAEVGLGQAHNKPADGNFTYTSPMSVYFRLGANYNILFNSNPDYAFYGGLRYGFSPFSYTVSDVTVDAPYWGEEAHFSLPTQHATAGWLEVCLGLRVKLWRNISAGWTFKYHQILHQSAMPDGPAWYIPGYGARNGALTGAFHITYTIPLSNLGINRRFERNDDTSEALSAAD